MIIKVIKIAVVREKGTNEPECKQAASRQTNKQTNKARTEAYKLTLF